MNALLPWRFRAMRLKLLGIDVVDLLLLELAHSSFDRDVAKFTEHLLVGLCSTLFPMLLRVIHIFLWWPLVVGANAIWRALLSWCRLYVWLYPVRAGASCGKSFGGRGRPGHYSPAAVPELLADAELHTADAYSTHSRSRASRAVASRKGMVPAIETPRSFDVDDSWEGYGTSCGKWQGPSSGHS